MTATGVGGMEIHKPSSSDDLPQETLQVSFSWPALKAGTPRNDFHHAILQMEAKSLVLAAGRNRSEWQTRGAGSSSLRG